MLIARRLNNTIRVNTIRHNTRRLHYLGQDYYHNKHSLMLENEILKIQNGIQHIHHIKVKYHKVV